MTLSPLLALPLLCLGRPLRPLLAFEAPPSGIGARPAARPRLGSLPLAPFRRAQ